MANTHRLVWIDAQIRAGRYPNATTIAARFEISPRQAARDLEYLRHTLGAPLVWSAGHRGYAYDDDTFVVPGLMLTAGDRSSLAWLAHRYRPRRR